MVLKAMFLHLVFLAAILQFVATQNQCTSEIRRLKADLQVELRDTVVRIIRGEIQGIEDVLFAINQSLNTGNTLIRALLESNMTAYMADIQEILHGKASKEDVYLIATTLNNSLTEGHRHITEMLQDIRSSEAQGQCITRNELEAVRSMCATRGEVQGELQSLASYVTEVQQNNTARLLQVIHPGSLENPVASCKHIPLGSPSGEYWIMATTGKATHQHCDMTKTCCGSTGGWMRVANLDMTDPNQQCPPGFRLTPYHTCGRPNYQSVGGHCISAIFPVHGVSYSKVCGRVIAYQNGHADAFTTYHVFRTTIDGAYVDGASLTYGSSPRKHIWTFVCALQETGSCPRCICHCTHPDAYPGSVPYYVGQDYFCDTAGRTSWFGNGFDGSADPLWDGQGCGPNSSCCNFNSPPWFCKQLSQPSRDDIELRLCGGPHEDTPLEIVELYVQ